MVEIWKRYFVKDKYRESMSELDVLSIEQDASAGLYIDGVHYHEGMKKHPKCDENFVNNLFEKDYRLIQWELWLGRDFMLKYKFVFESIKKVEDNYD